MANFDLDFDLKPIGDGFVDDTKAIQWFKSAPKAESPKPVQIEVHGHCYICDEHNRYLSRSIMAGDKTNVCKDCTQRYVRP